MSLIAVPKTPNIVTPSFVLQFLSWNWVGDKDMVKETSDPFTPSQKLRAVTEPGVVLDWTLSARVDLERWHKQGSFKQGVQSKQRP